MGLIMTATGAANSTAKLVTVFGGSGFVGRAVVRMLAKQGYRVRVAVRKPNLAHDLRPLGDVGQVSLVQANLRDADSIIRATEGADAVINLVAVMKESGAQSFAALHHQGAMWVAQAAERAKVPVLVHVSSIGADADAEAAYARTKGLGEQAVRDVRPDAVIIRPSIIFGNGDGFFNQLGGMVAKLPIIPLIGGGETRFQPVYVTDVATAIVNAVADKTAAGKTYELGGPATYSFEELLRYVAEETDRERFFVPLPWALAKLEARLTGFLPGAPLTMDQVLLLQNDNVVGEGVGTLADLGVSTPKTMEAIVPSYIWRFRRTGEFKGAAA